MPALFAAVWAFCLCRLQRIWDQRARAPPRLSPGRSLLICLMGRRGSWARTTTLTSSTSTTLTSTSTATVSTTSSSTTTSTTTQAEREASLAILCGDVEFRKVNGYYYYRFTPTQIAEEGRFCCSSGMQWHAVACSGDMQIWQCQAEAAAARRPLFAAQAEEGRSVQRPRLMQSQSSISGRGSC